MKQATAYDKEYPGSLRKKDLGGRFRFGDQVTTSQGSLLVRSPFGTGAHVTLKVDFVDLDIPLLIYLDFLKRHQILVECLNLEFIYTLTNERLPLIEKAGNIFFEWQKGTERFGLFTREELYRLHLHFLHPSARKQLWRT